MELTAVFETWHLGDGKYPPLQKDMVVNLSFEIQPDRLEVMETSSHRFEHLGCGEYHFVGTVIRVYNDNSPERLVVIESDGFRFTSNHQLARTAPWEPAWKALEPWP